MLTPSELLKLNWRDVAITVIAFAGISALVMIKQFLTAKTGIDWNAVLDSGITAGITALLLCLGFDEQGKLGGKI